VTLLRVADWSVGHAALVVPLKVDPLVAALGVASSEIRALAKTNVNAATTGRHRLPAANRVSSVRTGSFHITG
jgi:hypothetical protein